MTKKEQTKEKIRQAAHRCVARFGFEKTTLDDIAAAVGLNKASLYYYYKNKEDIFLEITTGATRQFVETLISGTEKIEGGIEAQVKFFLNERAAYYLRLAREVHISEESLRQVEHLFWEQIKDVRLQELLFLKNLLDAAARSGEIQTVDNQMFAANLIAFSEAAKQRAKEKYGDLQQTEILTADIAENLNFMLGLLFKSLRKQA